MSSVLSKKVYPSVLPRIDIAARCRCTKSAKICMIDARRRGYEDISRIDALYTTTGWTPESEPYQPLPLQEVKGSVRPARGRVKYILR